LGQRVKAQMEAGDATNNAVNNAAPPVAASQ
jgi:membrane-bound lytic murein transglycosylase B